MKKINKTLKNNEKAITLIALVITIIVLLILAAISLTMLTGNNSILKRATDAKELTEVGQEKESISLAYNSVIIDKTSRGDTSAVTGTELDPAIKTYDEGASAKDGYNQIIVTFENGHKYSIDATGNIKEYTPPSVEDLIKVGDYIEYDPIHLDVGKTQNVDSNLLTYTSLTGSTTEHGNGYESNESNKGQKFTAKSGLKWRMLSISNGTIEIIPSEVIKKDDESQNNGYLGFTGARGYLYAEQELHEICKIYGYGYGADTSQITTFKIGGPYPGEETTRTITGSGARSITIEDINKIAKVGKVKDGVNIITEFSELDSRYGNKSLPPTDFNILYPTINADLSYPEVGISKQPAVNSLEHTWYILPKSKISSQEIQSMLFGKYYWIASRATWPGYGNTQWHVFAEAGSQFQPMALFQGADRGAEQFTNTAYGVMPVVTLKSNVVDVSTLSSTKGNENDPWKLK